MLAAGTQFGFYEIRRPLGAGSMGRVYEAWDTRLRRLVALKILTDVGSDRSAGARLLREARAAAALNHSNICTVYEVGETDGIPFLAMEFINGRTLHDVIASDGLDASRVRRLGRQLVAAVSSAHDAGVIHRDLKSANVMVSADGELKVLDFGIAARLAGPLDATNTATQEDSRIGGTLPYMAPEVLSGSAATSRSDIWSLGVLLYEMTTGRLPFHRTTSAATAAAILHDPPPPLPPSTPPDLGRIISRCLEKADSLRPATAGEIGLGLDLADAAPRPTPFFRHRRLAFPHGHQALEGVCLGWTAGGDALHLEGHRHQLGLRDLCVERVFVGSFPGASRRSAEARGDRPRKAPLHSWRGRLSIVSRVLTRGRDGFQRSAVVG